MKVIRQWKDRLAGVNHSKGTFSTMIRAAMLEEIEELRKQNRALLKKQAADRARIQIWQAHTRRYQKQLGKMK